MARSNSVKFNNFSGGESDSEVLGIKGSFSEMVGVDIHSEPGILKVNQALVKNSGTTVTDLPRFSFYGSDGATYWFGDTGNIYKRTSAGSWSLVVNMQAITFGGATSFEVGDTITGNDSGASAFIISLTSTTVHIVVNITGTFTASDNACTTDGGGGGSGTSAYSSLETDVPILGASEYDGFFYWATDTALHKIAKSGTWATDITKVGTLNSANWHDMITQGTFLFIGNALQIATVDDAGTFTANGTPDITLGNLPHNYNVKTIDRFGIDIIVGVETVNGDNTSRVFRWDTKAPLYISSDQVGETDVSLFFEYENNTYAVAGKKGNIYFYNGEVLLKYKKVKGDYKNKSLKVYPGSNSIFGDINLFGISNDSSNPTLSGVKGFGRRDKNYPIALTTEYVPSHGKTSSVEVGAIETVGDTLLVAWKDSTTYGVDAISYTAKHSGAYIKTISIGGNRRTRKHYKDYQASYKSLPASTAIQISYYKNFASATALTGVDDTTNYKVHAEEDVDAGTMAFKLAFTISSNNAPEVEELSVRLGEEDIV